MVLEIIQIQGPRGFYSATAFGISATITQDPGILQWNTLSIDCSSHEAPNLVIEIFDLSLIVLGIIQIQGSRGFHSSTAFGISATITQDPGILQ